MTDENPHARLGLTSEAGTEEIEKARGEIIDFLESAPAGLRRWAEGEIAAVEDACAGLSRPARARTARRSPLRRIAVAIATLAVSAAVVVGVYNTGGGEGEAEPSSGGAAEASGLSPDDEFRLAKLMGKLDAEPNDVATLTQLGNTFFEARDYNSAGGWMKRALAIEPDNVKARLGLGAAEFNIGDVADARRDWLRVIAADPENVEAYYDLGFLYVSEDPPEMAAAKKMWGKVVALAPDSAVAKTVATHLKGLEKANSAAANPAGGEG